MSLSIEEIKSTNKVENSSKTKKSKSDVKVFNSNNTQSSSKTTPDWDISHYETIKKWGAKPYKWSSITGTNDAIEKSQQSLMDMMRYFEGDSKNNYKAKEKYVDLNGKGTKTYGYGITQLPKKFGKLKPPENENEAYDVLMLYLDKVSYEESKTMFKKCWNKFPQSLREALIDFNFNKGASIVKTRKDAIMKAFNENDWSKLIENLVYTLPGASKAEKNEKAGLYKRSLSRAILAVRDVKHTPEIDKTIEKIYTNSRACALKEGKDVVEIDKIYNAYLNGGKIVETPVESGKNSKFYDITDKVSVYSIALGLRPQGQDSECLKAIVNEIIKLNEIKTDGFDEKGFPKCRSIENETLELPKSIVYNGKRIYLNTPTKYKETTEPVTKVVVDSVANHEQNDSIDTNKVDNNGTKKNEKKSIGFFEFTKTLVSLSLIKIGNYISDLFSSDTESKQNSEDDFDYSKTPFERLLNSKNTTIEEDGDFQIITAKYKVKKGDGVWRLSKTYNLDEEEFCKLNGIEDRNKIKCDEILNIQKLGYKVKAGDSLYKISKLFGVDIITLKDLNNIEDENAINENQMLELPGFVHTVTNGETLSEIANKVGMPIETLMKINGLTTDKIKVGDKIKVVYNDATFATTKRTVSIDKETNSTVETVDFGATNDLATRPLLQKARKVNGKYVATRAVFEPTAQGKLSGKTIIVNAGHGYTSSGYVDPGTLGMNGLDDEYLINYDNAMRLKDELCAKGAKVIFLQGKRSLIYDELAKKNNKSDLFVSVHINAGGKAPKDRTEIFVTTEDINANNKCAKFAIVAETKFDKWIAENEKISADDKFISPSSKKQDYAQICHESRKKQGKKYRLGLLDKVRNTQNVPAVIWEVGYMNSPKGQKRLSDNGLMNNYAKVMANSVEEYFN